MPSLDPSLLDSPGSVLIDDRDVERRSGRTYVFSAPVDSIVARKPGDVPAALERLDRSVASGMYVAGYLAYETGLVLDKPIGARHASPLPLIWLGLYDRCLEMDAEDVALGPPGLESDVRDVALNVPEREYLTRVRTAREYISAGDVYQVNYTAKLVFDHIGSARSLFARLRESHPVGHSAFVNLGDAQIVSLSPELFLRTEGRRVIARPMKGTIRRGRWCAEDVALAAQLASDEKNRAENLMIVDLMRNDIGRISVFGGVSVPRLFHAERYASLWQMTSDVEGCLREEVAAGDVLRAVFPCGSVTGAPKIRAMEIIEELEREVRGVYCGSIGMFQPGGDMLLNVAIRTIVKTGRHCEMGIGSGIVADSEPEAEYREALLKGAFLGAGVPAFDLLETLRFETGRGYAFLEEHLDRIAASAAYFGRPFNRSDAGRALEAAVEIWLAHRNPGNDVGACVRLLLAADGCFRTEQRSRNAPVPGPVDLVIAARRVDPDDVFLYHKTTHRAAFNDDLRSARKLGCFDALYANTRGQLTEGTFTSLVVEIGGRKMTPSIHCGLLSGIWRQSLLDSGEVAEQEVTLDDMRGVTRVWVGNSVRGQIEVKRIWQAGDGREPRQVFWQKPGGPSSP